MESSPATRNLTALRAALRPAALLLTLCVSPTGLAAAQTPATAAEAASAPADPASPAAAAPSGVAADTAAKPDEHPEFHGSLELDNQYSQGTRPLRTTLALSYSNLLAKQDELSALYQVSPQDAKQVSVFIANYATHPLPYDLQPSLYFLNSNSSVPVADTVGVLGKGQIAGFRLSRTLGAAKTQSLILSMDYRHFRSTTALDETSASVTPVSYLNLSLAYAGNWSSTHHEQAVTLSASYGPHGGANASNGVALGDFHARENYFYLRADGTVLVLLPKDLRLYVRVAGQYSGRSLIVDEDYPVAGIDGVRGYLEAQVLGDRAIKSTLQLQTPPWKHGTKQLADGFVFFDSAVAELLDVAPGELLRLHARSWGLGADLFPWKTVSASIVWARPLVTAGSTQAGDARVLFLLRGSF